MISPSSAAGTIRHGAHGVKREPSRPRSRCQLARMRQPDLTHAGKFEPCSLMNPADFAILANRHKTLHAIISRPGNPEEKP